MKKSVSQLQKLSVFLLLITLLGVNNLFAQGNGLFFSEYGEGSSYNKYLEIYNGTGSAVTLSDFDILTNYNGGPWTGMYTFPAGVVLAPNDVYVIANDGSDSLILAKADEILAYNVSGYVMSFNGNDVRALVSITPTDTTILDIIGRYDLVDPGSGWDVAGVSNGTLNHTLVRKSSVCTGNSDWDLAAGTDSLNSEWIVYPNNTWDYLGSHIGCSIGGTYGLFFSEYGEGSGSNKYLEIYNISGGDIVLSDYSILTNYNGNPWSGAHNFPPGTVLANNSVWVLANDGADSVVLAQADQLMAWDSSGYVVGFNGDDVRALVEINGADTTILDIIGRYDFVDPGDGWAVAGVPDATKEHTLVRKSSVCTGNPDWDAAAGTNANNSEWIVYPQNTWTYLGSHTGCVTVDTVPPNVSQVFPTSATSVTVIFDEGVNSTANNAANYTGLGAISNVYHPADGDSVILTLSTPLTNGSQSTLTIANIEDIAGNVMSAPQSFTFIFNSLIADIVITEIMYNVPSSDTMEFIEIFNNGNAVANIGGYYFSQGVTFEFPANTMMNPGEYLLVTINSFGTELFFGITGTYEWANGSGLSNSGEDIEISNTVGDVISYVDYDDQAPWPTTPDGGGPSLTFCDPSLDNNNPANWSASVEFAGVLTTGDTIWATPLAGCFAPPTLAADFMANNLVITQGSSVDFTDLTAGGPTFWEWTFDGAGPVNSNMQNPTGIQYLTIGTYDVTLYVSNATGSDTLTKTDYITVVDSTVADIVITEIMYNPPESGSDSLEFIEIYNNGSTTVNLMDYSFTLGVVFTFPNVDINPGEYMVIAVDSMACVNTFGINPYQWASGGLSNGGEPVELSNDIGLVVDFVHYDDQAPWPTEPDGDGPSLTFCDPSLDNMDPHLWSASTEFAAINSAGDTIWATPGAGCAAAFDISGLLVYDNPPSTPLNNSIVYLKDVLGNKLDSIMTDNTGYFIFAGKPAGDYVLDASTDKAWGGANSVDALAIMQHFVGQITLTNLRLKVADVNASDYINSVDALMVQQRFISLINAFPSGDWGFDNDTFNLSNDLIHNFHGLCYGDVNGSFTPSTKKMPTVNLYQNKTLDVSAGETVQVEFKVDAAMTVGAISLIINYPDDIVEVLDVNIPGSDNENLLFSTNNGKLAVSWYNLDPVLLYDSETLLSLKLMVKNTNEDIAFEIEGISELGNQYAEVIENVNLYYPKLQVNDNAQELVLGQNYPNPFAAATVIDVVLPEAGHISIDVYNSSGKIIMSVLNETMDKGIHNISIDGNDLAEGMYVYKINFNGQSIQSSSTRRMLIVR